MKNKRNKKKFFSIILILIAFMLAFIYYKFVFNSIHIKNTFSRQLSDFYSYNEHPIFKISDILLYSSADAVDNTQEQNLQNLTIYQFTDISIKIDNTSYITSLTEENTIDKLWIDDIKINVNSDNWAPSLLYKSPFDFGKFKLLEQPENKDKINFEILNTNEQNQNSEYSTPKFYTDCSNPITLGYLCKDSANVYAIYEDSNRISFSGKILNGAGIELNNLAYTLNFRINLVNKLGDTFFCYLNLSDTFNTSNKNELYDGHVLKEEKPEGSIYNFIHQL